MTVNCKIEVEFCVYDFSQIGLRKMAAIYSHASGREVRVEMIVWPNPVLTADIDLDDISVNFEHECKEKP